MLNIIHRFLYQDLYIPVWPNIAASIILGIPAFFHIIRKIDKNHTEHIALMHKHHKEHMDAINRNKEGELVGFRLPVVRIGVHHGQSEAPDLGREQEGSGQDRVIPAHGLR